MNPQIRHAQRACESAKATQAVVVFIDKAKRLTARNRRRRLTGFPAPIHA
jgi:hypothetical protein